MINTLKRGKTEYPARGQTSAGNTGRGLAEISDPKHLTSREVERLMLRHARGFALVDHTRLIPGLSRAPEHSAHRQVHGDQPGAVRKVVALTK